MWSLGIVDTQWPRTMTILVHCEDKKYLFFYSFPFVKNVPFSMGETKFNVYNRVQRRNKIHCDTLCVIC
jgi:hypothetical protein